MGRETKRVPLEFDWPLREVWDGYLMPKRLRERECATCDGTGYSPEARRLKDRWYGRTSFEPEETGSIRLTANTPEVRRFAERNITNSPEYYEHGERAVVSEAQRLANLWNGSWSHHLAQTDVDALVDAGRLRDFTHRFVKGQGWVELEPKPTVTAVEINKWSLDGFGHDSLNCSIVIEAACKRDGLPLLCPTCKGHGSIERWPGQREEAEEWDLIEPPVGDGWQMWETTSEGSPISPVFASAEELAEWCADDCTVFGETHASSEEWLRIILGKDFAHVEIVPGIIAI